MDRSENLYESQNVTHIIKQDKENITKIYK